MRQSLLFLFGVLLLATVITSSVEGRITLESIEKLVGNSDTTIYAGVSSVDATMPIGVPLAGYNWGERRVSHWPIPTFTRYTTFMSPSTGIMDTMFAKGLVIKSGEQSFAVVSIDAIGADGTVFKKAYDFAVAQGFSVPFENVVLSGTHSHSATGAVTPQRLWELVPATDMVKEEAQTEMASYIAAAMVMAEKNLQPVKFGIGTSALRNVTVNRRHKFSPYVNQDSVDTQLGIFRIDNLNDKPIATLWNFAIHGTCYGPSNMQQSGDIMGLANSIIEREFGGVSIFINADAGDIAPGPGMCDPKPNFKGSQRLADAVIAARASVQTVTALDAPGIQVASRIVDFGKTNLNITLARFANCTSGGEMQICTICRILNCRLNLHLDGKWVENTPKFTGVRMSIKGHQYGLVTIPGEAIQELGTQIKQISSSLGFNTTLLFGYSNNHMAYFTTEREYEVGGYESQLTFWGIDTAAVIRASAKSVLELVKPAK